QKVAEIYSPELLTAQRELLYIIENDANNQSLIESAKKKLQLLGFSSKQIEELIKKKEASSTISIYSQYDGYVITENQPSSTSSSIAPASMNGGMNSSSAANTTATNSPAPLIRQGDYVTTGQILFKIVNTSALRIELNLPLSATGSIQNKDEVDLDFGTGASEKAQVDFIQPFLNEGQEFIKIRLYTSKIKDPQIGQLVQATIQLKPSEGLWIPTAAILDQGLNQIVFIKERGVFKPKEIQTEVVTNGWTQVKGLASSDEIASDAHYLVDSEDFIKTKN
ncbi:MAG TPA: efflux RND transporter periplasmic adaptor subunit, partial [Cyclobacteriaceae bacterium]